MSIESGTPMEIGEMVIKTPEKQGQAFLGSLREKTMEIIRGYVGKSEISPIMDRVMKTVGPILGGAGILHATHPPMGGLSVDSYATGGALFLVGMTLVGNAIWQTKEERMKAKNE